MSEKQFDESEKIAEATEYATKTLEFADIVWKHYMINQQKKKGKGSEWLDNEDFVKYVSSAFRHYAADSVFRKYRLFDNKYADGLTSVSKSELNDKIDSFDLKRPEKTALKNRVYFLEGYIINPHRIPWVECRQELVQAGLMTEEPKEAKKKWGKGLDITIKPTPDTMDGISGGNQPYDDGDEFG